MIERAGLENRDPQAPPCDALAEAIVLSYVLHHAPQKAVDCDLLPLLHFPEHRLLWQVMQRVYRPDESREQFYLRWLNESERTQRGLSDVLSGVGESWSRWQAHRLAHDTTGYASVSTTDWDWWLARLRQVAAARRLIEDAQRMAERAWQGDVAGALEAVGRATRERSPVRVEV